MVNHGLISAALFLLAGAIERRTTTGELARLGGMARGRPILATILISTGVIALGRTITPFPEPSEQTVLVRSGIYSAIRHPIYAGLMLAALGCPDLAKQAGDHIE